MPREHYTRCVGGRIQPDPNQLVEAVRWEFKGCDKEIAAATIVRGTTYFAPFVIDHHIVWFHVPVHNTLRVTEIERLEIPVNNPG